MPVVSIRAYLYLAVKGSFVFLMIIKNNLLHMMIIQNTGSCKSVRSSINPVVTVDLPRTDGGVALGLQSRLEGIAVGGLAAAGVELEGEGQLGQGTRVQALFGGEVLGGFPTHEERDQGKVAGEQGAEVGAITELVMIDRELKGDRFAGGRLFGDVELGRVG